MNQKRKVVISILLVIVNYFSLSSQGKSFENIIFERSPLSDISSQTAINAIVQDKMGFIWLGTNDGLLRFDGYDYKVYKGTPNNINSLTNNQIMTLAVDNKGRIWIGTLGGGINIFIPETEEIIHVNQENKILQKIRNNEIWKIYIDRYQNIWIGTSDGLFKAEVSEKDNRLEKVTFKEYYYSNTPTNHFWVRSIYHVDDNIYLLGSIAGILHMDISRNEIKPINAPIVQHKMVTTICEGKKNDLWLGTIEDGVYHVLFDKSNKVLKVTELATNKNEGLFLPLRRIEQVVIDRFGNLWIASRQGLGRINLYTQEASIYLNDINNQTSLSDNRLSSVFEDKNGVLWIGTESKGINRLDLYQKKFITLRSNQGKSNFLSDNYISCIWGKEKGKIWIAYDGAGCDFLESKGLNDIKITRPAWNNQLLNNNIICVYESKDHTLWFGSTRNSLGKVNLKTGQVSYQYLFGYIFCIYEDSNENLWIGTWGSGLYRYDRKKGVIENYKKTYGDTTSLSNDIVISIYEDNNKQLWFGTKGGGLCRLANVNISEGEKIKFVAYQNNRHDTSSLSHNDVYSIMQTQDGHLWLGTGGGINKMLVKHTPKGTKVFFKAYTEENGLPNNTVYGILEDALGNLWMSTNKGLSKFNPKTEIFTNYDIHDGIQSNEFHLNAYYKDPSGIMFFGGNGGITYFDPLLIQANPFVPEIIFTKLKIQGQTVEVGQVVNGRIVLNTNLNNTNQIIITYKDKEFTLEFSSNHYAIPEKNKFKYRLIGFNDKWQEVSNKHRSVTYTNLSQGDYIFQIMASNNDGVWPEKPQVLKIKVLPPPWLTVWAFLVYALILASAILLFKKYTLIKVTRKHQLLIDSLEKRKIEEITQMKIQFFTNISHELRTPLTLISNPLKDLLENKKIDVSVRKDLQIIKRNVERLLQLINQLLDFRKIDAGELKLKITQTNLINLLQEVIQSFEQYALSRNITLNYFYKDEEIVLWLDREKIVTVFFNLISNAFKYSPNNSNIIIEVNVLKNSENEDGIVEIKIIDEGIGIEKEFQQHIFERFYQIGGAHQKGKAGTGIGLSISKEYIEAHGGTISVDSEPGKGATFITHLPLRKNNLANYIELTDDLITDKEKEEATTQLLNALTSSLEGNWPDVGTGTKKTLLIIEDNTDLLHYLSARFTNKYHVIVAENGNKGLQLAVERNPDIIITDIMMPDLDGITLCKKLKNDLHTSHIPIIILTAKTTEESNIEGLEAGADAYVLKPFSLEVLKAQVKSLLESREKIRLSFSKNIILQPKEIVATSLDERFMIKLMEVIEKNIANPDFGIKHLTDEMNMSHSVIFRKVKALTGSNVIEFIRSVRLKKAAQLLHKQKLPVSEVSLMVGFNDAKYFSKCFIKEFGVSPREYTKGIVKESTENDNDTLEEL